MLKIIYTYLLSLSTIIFFLFFIGCSNDKSKIIMVAASLREIVDEEYLNTNNKDFFINYGGSISLSRRIENNQKKIGAVIFASNSSIDNLIEKGIIDKKNLRTFAKNSLVLARSNRVESYEDFIKNINQNLGQKIVIADKNIAPAGKYSNQVLEKILSKEIINEKVIASGDVSYVSNLLIYNSDYYGIIYKTEAIKNNLEIIYEFPNNLHDEIEYKMAILNNNNNISIVNFIDKLTSENILNKLTDLGFKVEK